MDVRFELAGHVIIISHDEWRDRFGAVIGDDLFISVDGHEYAVDGSGRLIEVPAYAPSEKDASSCEDIPY